VRFSALELLAWSFSSRRQDAKTKLLFSQFSY
jgi:hypothetical protein